MSRQGRCVQWEVDPSGQKSDPVAWIAGAEETKRRKSIDKAIFGMVSELSGRNESERTGDLETYNSRGRTHHAGVKAAQNVAD